MRTTEEKAAAFRALHTGEPFVIPNPWDVGSARALEAQGFSARHHRRASRSLWGGWTAAQRSMRVPRRRDREGHRHPSRSTWRTGTG
jgi:hypothetical protein